MVRGAGRARGSCGSLAYASSFTSPSPTSTTHPHHLHHLHQLEYPSHHIIFRFPNLESVPYEKNLTLEKQVNMFASQPLSSKPQQTLSLNSSPASSKTRWTKHKCHLIGRQPLSVQYLRREITVILRNTE